jgi:hypothetical protein
MLLFARQTCGQTFFSTSASSRPSSMMMVMLNGHRSQLFPVTSFTAFPPIQSALFPRQEIVLVVNLAGQALGETDTEALKCEAEAFLGF